MIVDIWLCILETLQYMWIYKTHIWEICLDGNTCKLLSARGRWCAGGGVQETKTRSRCFPPFQCCCAIPWLFQADQACQGCYACCVSGATCHVQLWLLNKHDSFAALALMKQRSKAWSCGTLVEGQAALQRQRQPSRAMSVTWHNAYLIEVAIWHRKPACCWQSSSCFALAGWGEKGALGWGDPLFGAVQPADTIPHAGVGGQWGQQEVDMGLPQALWSLGWGWRLECILMLLVPLTLEGHIHAQLLLLYIYVLYMVYISWERYMCVSAK